MGQLEGPSGSRTKPDRGSRGAKPPGISWNLVFCGPKNVLQRLQNIKCLWKKNPINFLFRVQISPRPCIMDVWRLIVFAPFFIIIFLFFFYYYSYSSPFFPRTMNLSTADLRNYRTEFHETWWSYRYMYLVDPKVSRFVVKGVKAIFLGVQRGWGLL